MQQLPILTASWTVRKASIFQKVEIILRMFCNHNGIQLEINSKEDDPKIHNCFKKKTTCF